MNTGYEVRNRAMLVLYLRPCYLLTGPRLRHLAYSTLAFRSRGSGETVPNSRVGLGRALARWLGWRLRCSQTLRVVALCVGIHAGRVLIAKT
jgi:hypothetical protein